MAYVAWSVVFAEQPSAAKWNILGTNDASFNDGTGIADGVIKPEHLKNGSSTLNTWVWDAWTPSLGNLSGGTTTYAAYMRIGNTIHLKFKYTMAGANVSGDVTMSLPVNARNDYGAGDICEGSTHMLDANGGDRLGLCRFNSASEVNVLTLNTSGSPTALSSTSPFTWASGDNITVAFAYEATA